MSVMSRASSPPIESDRKFARRDRPTLRKANIVLENDEITKIVIGRQSSIDLRPF